MKFKKSISLALTSVMIASVFAGCGSTPEPTKSEDNATASESTTMEKEDMASTDGLSGTLKILSFSPEVQTMAIAFEKENPNVNIEYDTTSMTDGAFQQKLQQTLASGADVPDVVVLEAGFVKQYVESPYLADLSDLKADADAIGSYAFTTETGTNPDGQNVAFCYQATPGGLFYRRSLAKEYLGTDDPDEVQAMMSDMSKYTEVAGKIKEASNGNTYMIGSLGDFSQLFYANRTSPWVVDNTLTIDPVIDDLMETSKAFVENGYEAQTSQWQSDWFAGMNDTLKNAAGEQKQIFTYLLPTWGLTYVLMANGKTDTTDTTGDWALIPGPMSYQWGGSWLASPTGAENPELAKEFIKFATLNTQTLENWANGVYTNEYLKAVDSSVPDDLSQPAGDFVSSQVAVDNITPSFGDSDAAKFLSGQNPYEIFGKIAPNVNGKLLQGTDDSIQRSLNDVVDSYANGKITKEEAIQNFKDSVQTDLPDIEIK